MASTYGIGNNSGCVQTYSDAPPRQPEVLGWIDSVGYSVERLYEIAAQLSARLEPVLAPALPSTNDCDKQQAANCPMAAAIQAKVINLNDIEARLRSLVSRLEI